MTLPTIQIISASTSGIFNNAAAISPPRNSRTGSIDMMNTNSSAGTCSAKTVISQFTIDSAIINLQLIRIYRLRHKTLFTKRNQYILPQMILFINEYPKKA